MKKARDAAKRVALGAFAAAGRAEENVGVVFHEQMSFVSQKIEAAQPIRFIILSEVKRSETEFEESRGETCRGIAGSLDFARDDDDYFAATGSTFTRRPARSKRTCPSTSAKIV